MNNSLYNLAAIAFSGNPSSLDEIDEDTKRNAIKSALKKMVKTKTPH